jgi:hypothetical protein
MGQILQMCVSRCVCVCVLFLHILYYQMCVSLLLNFELPIPCGAVELELNSTHLPVLCHTMYLIQFYSDQDAVSSTCHATMTTSSQGSSQPYSTVLTMATKEYAGGSGLTGNDE